MLVLFEVVMASWQAFTISASVILSKLSVMLATRKHAAAAGSVHEVVGSAFFVVALLELVFLRMKILISIPPEVFTFYELCVNEL